MRKNQEGEAMFRNCNSHCFSFICKALNRTISKGMDTTPQPGPAQPSPAAKEKARISEGKRVA